ncbi:MAG: hypothetical protein HDS75_03320 [Bacteroidales bacterium]|nr:hypothetical protein [Bacteroidales bacterium]MBD5213839.1 hypothetical protein [Bacteroidales bacterium]
MAKQKDKELTPGEYFVQTMGKIFSSEVEKDGRAPYNIWRNKLPFMVSMPTFRRIYEGSTSVNVAVLANVADAFGYELKLVKKSSESENEELLKLREELKAIASEIMKITSNIPNMSTGQ